jgi:glycine/D-amino acid oxidase-like deaminating enzyme/nitrite reductase/ring-hydroxylating ferredoxin subunit
MASNSPQTTSGKETNPSYWIDEQTTSYPSLATDLTADVVVIGAGIVGLTSAYLLHSAGKKVILLEANRVGQGSTGFSTAKLCSLHSLLYQKLESSYDLSTAATYAAANQAGIELIAKLSSDLAIDCDFERQSAYTYTTDKEYVDSIRTEAGIVQKVGLPGTFTTETNLPFPVLGAVRVDNQAQFDPYRYCVGLAEAFINLGGTIYEQSRAQDVSEKETCLVSTNGGTVRAKHVVVATLLPFLDRGMLFGYTYPSRSYGIKVSLNSPAPEGMYISAESPVRSVRSLADRQSLIVVGEHHKVGQDSHTERHYEALEEWARKNFAVTKVTHRCSAQDYVPVDDLPFIGRIGSGSEKVFIATAFRKWGLALGTSAASILTDLIIGRENSWAETFDATRTNLIASAKELVVESLDVAKSFVGDRLKSLVAKDVSELAIGEGAIAKCESGKVAAYRDEQGVLHTVSPICTHLGCYVQWNSAEKSWDCPCHGSRFDCDGRILTGPAVRDLESIEPSGKST